MPLPAAVLWDMDGTLVDTEPYWMEAEEALVAEYGGTWTTEHALNLVGLDLIDAGTYIRDEAKVALEPAEIVERLLDSVVVDMVREVPWRAGALDLIDDARRHGVPLGLVTMSYQRFVAPVLAALPPDTFRAVVTGDNVDRGKPHPEPYLAAARLLDVDPGDCIAIEDSNTGATSAEAAGCRVVVVENHVKVAPGARRVFLPTLADLTVADLTQAVAALRS